MRVHRNRVPTERKVGGEDDVVVELRIGCGDNQSDGFWVEARILNPNTVDEDVQVAVAVGRNSAVKVEVDNLRTKIVVSGMMVWTPQLG